MASFWKSLFDLFSSSDNEKQETMNDVSRIDVAYMPRRLDYPPERGRHRRFPGSRIVYRSQRKSRRESNRWRCGNRRQKNIHGRYLDLRARRRKTHYLSLEGGSTTGRIHSNGRGF